MRSRPGRIALLLAQLAVSLSLIATAPAVHAATEPSAPRGFYAPPADPDAYRQALGLVTRGRIGDAAGIVAMARTPQAVWFGDQRPAEAERAVRATVRAAARTSTTPVLVLYDVPGRDCAGYSSGGAHDTAEYTAWIDAVARGIGHRPALVVLEPDSLALLPADCGQDDERGTKTAARYAELNHAVDRLAPLPRTTVYLDTGHPGWHRVGSLVPRLLKAGVARATGFFTNASNYQDDDANAWYGTLISACVAYARDGGDPAGCPDQRWPRAEARRWLAAHPPADPARMPHFVTDTSRNGQGPWTPPDGVYSDPQDWCNPPGRGLGERPTAQTGDRLHDAKLWIKNPGESDGRCLRGTPGPADPERGTRDPEAGDWFPDQALELVRFAQQPLT